MTHPWQTSVAPSAVAADFDSATAMLRALSRFLDGRDFPLLGLYPGDVEPLARAAVSVAEVLPRRLRQEMYAVGGWAEAVPQGDLGRIRFGQVADWLAGHYPPRQYPAVMIGSSNGAGMHLAAALGIPWLPQTLLIPIRKRGHADDPGADLADGRAPGRALLDANPDLQLHHMHDANQDRLMIRGMTYFRVKMRRLSDAYRRFIAEQLQPGGTVLVVDCGLRWPSTTVGDRHLFQHGALGGMDAEEYRRHWGGPEPDVVVPEAEWGYETAMDADLLELSLSHRLRWLRFEHPEDLSPVVADLHRQWYGRLGRPTGRLLAETFIAVEPYWAQRGASVPLWGLFGLQRSMAAFDRYLAEREPFEEIRLTLFPHGTDSRGVATADDWGRVLSRATKLGTLVGASPERFPADFGAMVRYHHDLAQIRQRFPLPAPLTLEEAEAGIGDLGGDRVTLSDQPRHAVDGLTR